MQVVDFSKTQVGTLVKRSDHWNKERCIKPRTKLQIGIIVGFEFFQEGYRRIVTWPVIHWEGAACQSLTHPANVALYRKQPFNTIEIDT